MSARILFQPFIGLTNAILTASSVDISFPIRRLRDPSPSATWRSLLGWNIVTGFNDSLDFTEGSAGDATATLTAGNYVSGDLLAAHIQTVMNVAATDNTYTVTYSAVTFKFTIARASGSDTISLEWSTGSNTLASVGECLGFSIAADDTSATTYTSDEVSYHSREWVQFQTVVSVTGAFVGAINGNWLSTGVVTLQANATDAWTAPTVSEVTSDATGPLPLRIDYFTEATHPYWRLLIDDVQNPVGFSELGLFHVSNFIKPAFDFRVSWTENRQELSDVGLADQGSTFVNEKPSRSSYSINFPALSESEKSNSFDPFLNFVRIGKPFFFSFEPDSNIAFTRYVMLLRSGNYKRVPGAQKWELQLTVSEVLG